MPWTKGRGATILSVEGLRQHKAWVVGLFTAALVLHLAVLAVTFRGNDAVEYFDDAKIALNILAGNGYSVSYEYRNWFFYEVNLETAKLQDPITQGTKTTAIKQPAYALILTGLFYCFGQGNFLVVFLVHAIISSLTVVLLFLCLRQTAPFGALAVALGATIYPPFVWHSVTVPESTALLMLLIAALWLWLVKIRQSAPWGLWVIGGVLGGVAVLTDPATLPFVGVSFGYGAWLGRRGLQNRTAAVLLASALSLLVVSPWLARNYVVFGRFPVFKSGMGQAFTWGLSRQFAGRGSWIPDERLLALEKAGRNLSEVEEDEAIRQELRSEFPTHWREYVTDDVPRHFLNLWWDVPRYWNNYSIRYMLGRRLPFLILLGLALPHLLRTALSLVMQPRVTLYGAVPEVSALTLMTAYTVLYSVFGAFHSRYRLPIELGLFIFAGATLRPAVKHVWERWVWSSSERWLATGTHELNPQSVSRSSLL
jgi:4-amino-4-deoxy-L-arabinose transferase-like glycosyltransferase